MEMFEFGTTPPASTEPAKRVDPKECEAFCRPMIMALMGIPPAFKPRTKAPSSERKNNQQIMIFD